MIRVERILRCDGMAGAVDAFARCTNELRASTPSEARFWQFVRAEGWIRYAARSLCPSCQLHLDDVRWLRLWWRKQDADVEERTQILAAKRTAEREETSP